MYAVYAATRLTLGIASGVIAVGYILARVLKKTGTLTDTAEA